jgi:hypothetical protein
MQRRNRRHPNPPTRSRGGYAPRQKVQDCNNLTSDRTQDDLDKEQRVLLSEYYRLRKEAKNLTEKMEAFKDEPTYHRRLCEALRRDFGYVKAAATGATDFTRDLMETALMNIQNRIQYHEEMHADISSQLKQLTTDIQEKEKTADQKLECYLTLFAPNFAKTLCVICQSTKADFAAVDSALPCGHVFHTKCILRWAFKSGTKHDDDDSNNTSFHCPTCRNKCVLKGIRHIETVCRELKECRQVSVSRKRQQTAVSEQRAKASRRNSSEPKIEALA